MSFIKSNITLLGLTLTLAGYSYAQQNPGATAQSPAASGSGATTAASTVDELNSAIEQRMKMAQNSIFTDYPVRSVGPTVMSGRVSDLDVDPRNPKVFYVAYASGGLYKTVNNGNSFQPVFDNQRALGMGDIALAESNPDILWVGTGENNSSRSSYAGAGVYKSTDAGKTWQFAGLDFTQHIGRVVIHPKNPDIVWVAAIGALYSTNDERGVYKTTDGGKSWKKTLFVDDSTGVIDLVVNPQNPDQLWAASWQRMREAGNFVGNGPGSAIYTSADGGETWTKSGQGFPQGKHVGRIGLDLCYSQPNVLYAVLDNQEEVKKEKKAADGKNAPKLKADQFNDMPTDIFLKLSEADLDTFLLQNNFPKKYTAKRVKEEVQRGKYQPKALQEYFGEANDANESLFDTEIKGAEVYRSDDSGKTWKKVNTHSLDGVYYTYGYYFGQIRVSPDNPDRVFIWGVPLVVSNDGGKTFTLADTVGNVHADHHAMWINPKDPDHILLGNDGGVNLSYDGGKSWAHLNTTSVGQFYTVTVDNATPYNIYGGLQDNGVFYGSSQSVPNKSKPWESIMGGDGMMVAVDPRDNSVVYTGFQYGNYFKLNKTSGSTKFITPKHDIGEAPLRFNWRTPLVMSVHNPDIIYLGSQRLHRSMDGAENWQTISPDLTKNKKQGNVPYSTLTVIAESPLTFGLIYAGTDDGNIQLTRNGGASWELISASLPADKWVSSIFPSKYDEATVYATLNGYRYDDFKSYVYKSTDYGKTWTSLKANLPDECANVIVEDPVNARLLYLGTDHGTYVTLNGGASWQLLNSGIPNVANYDMIVHPRENELVIATHGRSMYVMDVKPLQAITDPDVPVLAFTPPAITHNENWGEQKFAYIPQEQPGTQLMYYVGKPGNSPVKIEILDKAGKMVRSLTAENKPGFHRLSWDLKTESVAAAARNRKTPAAPVAKYVDAGTYKIRVSNGTASSETTLEIKPAGKSSRFSEPDPENESEPGGK
jgi:photosystem II stability/assembly factor-like uncharacterized protein